MLSLPVFCAESHVTVPLIRRHSIAAIPDLAPYTSFVCGCAVGRFVFMKQPLERGPHSLFTGIYTVAPAALLEPPLSSGGVCRFRAESKPRGTKLSQRSRESGLGA